MFKKIVKAVENFIFEPEKEINEVQLKTALILSSKVFENLYGHTKIEADKLAYKSVVSWLEEDRLDTALKQLWKAKIA